MEGSRKHLGDNLLGLDVICYVALRKSAHAREDLGLMAKSYKIVCSTFEESRTGEEPGAAGDDCDVYHATKYR